MIAILVPVLGRAQLIKPLVRNIQTATTHPYQLVFICSPDDPTRKTCRASSAITLVADWQPGPADYAKKIALGFRSTSEPWIFQAATDLVFHNGWDQHAIASAQRTGKNVVGTNDLGNPSVIRGKHSTHSLISREYINTHGGTADDSGIVFSEAYDHQYCDNEFIELARRRQEFVFSPNSIVEHRHPHWGKAEYDDTYTKALRATDDDLQLYIQRRKQLLRRR